MFERDLGGGRFNRKVHFQFWKVVTRVSERFGDMFEFPFQEEQFMLRLLLKKPKPNPCIYLYTYIHLQLILVTTVLKRKTVFMQHLHVAVGLFPVRCIPSFGYFSNLFCDFFFFLLLLISMIIWGSYLHLEQSSNCVQAEDFSNRRNYAHHCHDQSVLFVI